MDSILTKGLLTAVFYSVFVFHSQAQEELPPNLDPNNAVNTCGCFESKQAELRGFIETINLTFDQDSVAKATFDYDYNLLNSLNPQIDALVLTIENQEYEAIMVSDNLYQDSLIRVNYVIPSLIFDNNLFPSSFRIGESIYLFNKAQPLGRDKYCGEYFIPIK